MDGQTIGTRRANSVRALADNVGGFRTATFVEHRSAKLVEVWLAELVEGRSAKIAEFRLANIGEAGVIDKSADRSRIRKSSSCRLKYEALTYWLVPFPTSTGTHGRARTSSSI